jgi:hyperosmotically inducible protein
MRRLTPVVLALATLAAPQMAGAQISDDVLFERVAEAITSYPLYGIFDSIDVAVENRDVTLNGRVTTPAKLEEIAKRVEKVDGIRSLTNDIGVLPLSQSDNDLRYRVARAIYSHPVFWVYAQMPVPPIHIIVEHGRITLTGIAETEVQRTLAASLAQVSGSFGVTNNINLLKR